jgi:uncharacterized protein
MKNILLVTDGLIHPPLTARRALHSALVERTQSNFQHVRSMEKLPKDLENFSALVLYFHHKRISDTALEKLENFVSAGGGVLGIHTATASFKKQPAYSETLGGRFTGHGPVESFELQPLPESAIFKGIPSFRVKDELYLHELQPEIETHFTVMHKAAKIPAVWTTHYGRGRVCYAMPGHRTETMRNSIYQRVLMRGLAWVCGK